MRIRFGFLLLVICCFGGVQVSAGEVQVHAAASLTDALQEIRVMYEKQTGEKVIFNFAASSVIARQIEEGAPGDLFFSADEAKMNQLEKKGLIRKETRKSVLSNSLVIVVSSESDFKLLNPTDLVSVKGNIAIAEPRTVPAGIYAMEYLKKIGIWDRIADRIVPAENVRAALEVVKSGNADAGIVYKTDAKMTREVRIAFEVTPEEGPKIQYPLAVLTEVSDLQSAKAFYNFLISPTSLSVFRKYDFLILQ